MENLNSIYVAHVAEALEFLYDIADATDMARELLTTSPGVMAAADAYANGPATADEFYARVKLARTDPCYLYTVTCCETDIDICAGKTSRCPLCHTTFAVTPGDGA